MEKSKYDFINDDKRIVERNLRRNQLPKQDYQKMLKSLPDESERGEVLAVYSATNNDDSSSA